MRGTESPISVLCVDDEPGLADLTATFIERFDSQFSTATAQSAREGLNHLKQNDVDCIVSDYDMPEIDGLEFLEAVRATNPELPFILYTGHGSEELASDAISAGVSEYMQKGSGEHQYTVLGQRIHNVVTRYRARTEKHAAETILGAAPDGILVSVENEFVYANQAAADLYGASDPADLLGRQVTEFIHPDYRDDVNRQLQQVESGERHTDYISRTLLTREGEELPVQVTARHVKWDGDAGVVAIVRDISTEAAYIHQQERFESSFQRAFDAMVVTNDDGEYIDANQSACELFGVEKSDLLGQSIMDFLPFDAELENALIQLDEDADDRATLRIARADGEERIVEYVTTKDIVTGEHLSVLRDVTDQGNRESVLKEMYNTISNRDRPFEEKVQSLLELGRQELDVAYGTLSRIQGEDYIFEIVDTDDDTIQAGDVAPVSATNCEIVASQRKTLVLGDVARDAPEETNRAGYTDWGIACYLGAPVHVDDGVYGTFCFYDTTPRDGEFSEWEVTLVDLMSRWVSYELNHQMNTEQLEAQNRKLEQFSSIVSHDLRNPLNVLEGSLQLAEETGDPNHFKRCHDAVDRMNTLIDDLLSLARAGSVIEETEPVALRPLVQSCWEDVDVAEGTLQLELDQWTEIQADESRLRQLLENLIRNAFDHGNDETTVTVGDLENGFYVADDGPGIPEETREEVFESGYSTLDEGTGLGLAIADEIADAHGWSMDVKESDAGGARFEITGVENA